MAMLGRVSDGGAIINVASMAAMRFRGDIERTLAALRLPVEVSQAVLAEFIVRRAIGALDAYAFSKQLLVLLSKQLQFAFAGRQVRGHLVLPGSEVGIASGKAQM